MPLGVKRKVLEIDSQKILRPDPGLYSQYFPSYAIFCDGQIFIVVQNQVENGVSENFWFTKNDLVTAVGKIKGVGTFNLEKISIYEGFLLVIKFFYSYETLSM